MHRLMPTEKIQPPIMKKYGIVNHKPMRYSTIDAPRLFSEALPENSKGSRVSKGVKSFQSSPYNRSKAMSPELS